MSIAAVMNVVTTLALTLAAQNVGASIRVDANVPDDAIHRSAIERRLARRLMERGQAIPPLQIEVVLREARPDVCGGNEQVVVTMVLQETNYQEADEKCVVEATPDERFATIMGLLSAFVRGDNTDYSRAVEAYQARAVYAARGKPSPTEVRAVATLGGELEVGLGALTLPAPTPRLRVAGLWRADSRLSVVVELLWMRQAARDESQPDLGAEFDAVLGGAGACRVTDVVGQADLRVCSTLRAGALRVRGTASNETSMRLLGQLSGTIALIKSLDPVEVGVVGELALQPPEAFAVEPLREGGTPSTVHSRQPFGVALGVFVGYAR